jgi:hypothetical protein
MMNLMHSSGDADIVVAERAQKVMVPDDLSQSIPFLS